MGLRYLQNEIPIKMAKDKSSVLTDKQKLFCYEYLKDLNGTQAAIRAGYSVNTANEIASENLTKPNIQDFVGKLKSERVERCEITSDKVLKELAKIGFSDIRQFYGVDGQLKSIHELEDEAAGAVSSIKSYEEKLTTTDPDAEQIVQGTNKEIRMHDKIKALELIAKHIGFFEKDNEQIKNITPPTPVIVYNSAPPLASSEDKVDKSKKK